MKNFVSTLGLVLLSLIGFGQSYQGTYSTDYFGNTQYQDNRGTRGTYSTDYFGNTLYQDNKGNRYEISTDFFGNTVVRPK